MCIPSRFRTNHLLEQVQAVIILRSDKAIYKTIIPNDPKGKEKASKTSEETIEIEGTQREEEKEREKGE